MLSVFLALIASATAVPNHPYLPAKPAGLPNVVTPVLTRLNLALDAFTVQDQPVAPITSYEKWRRDGWPCEQVSGKARIPTKAADISAGEQRAFSGFYSWPYCRYLPWHCVFQERPMPDEELPIGNVIGYRLIRVSNSSDPEYYAVIEGIPHSVVKARTLVELEEKVVARFSAFVEASLDMQAYPSSVKKPSRAVPDFFIPPIANPKIKRPYGDCITAGVRFDF